MAGSKKLDCGAMEQALLRHPSIDLTIGSRDALLLMWFFGGLLGQLRKKCRFEGATGHALERMVFELSSALPSEVRRLLGTDSLESISNLFRDVNSLTPDHCPLLPIDHP